MGINKYAKAITYDNLPSLIGPRYLANIGEIIIEIIIVIILEEYWDIIELDKVYLLNNFLNILLNH